MCIKWFKKKEQQTEKKQVENKPSPLEKVEKILKYENIFSIIRIDKNNFITVRALNYCSLVDFKFKFNIWTFSKNNVLIINHDFEFDTRSLWNMCSNITYHFNETNGLKIAKNWIVNILENCVSQEDYIHFRNNIRYISDNLIHDNFLKYTHKINEYHEIFCDDIIDKIKRDDLPYQSCSILHNHVTTSYYIDDNNDMRNELENLYDKRTNIIRKHSTYPIYS